MSEPHEALILDLVAWVCEPKPYATVMEAWRTSCPRLPVWEDAVDRGLVAQNAAGMVAATAAGRMELARLRPG